MNTTPREACLLTQAIQRINTRDRIMSSAECIQILHDLRDETTLFQAEEDALRAVADLDSIRARENAAADERARIINYIDHLVRISPVNLLAFWTLANSIRNAEDSF